MTLHYSQRVLWAGTALLVLAAALLSFVLFAPEVRAEGNAADKQCNHPEKYIEGQPKKYVNWDRTSPDYGKHGVIGQPCADNTSDTKGTCVSLIKCDGQMCDGKPCKKPVPPGGPQPPEKKDDKPPELPKPPGGGDKKPPTPPQAINANCGLAAALGGGDATDASGKPCPKTTQTSETINTRTSSGARTAADQLKSLGDSLLPPDSKVPGDSKDAPTGKNATEGTSDTPPAANQPNAFGRQLAEYLQKAAKSLLNLGSPKGDGASAAPSAEVEGGGSVSDSGSAQGNSTGFNVPVGNNTTVSNSFFSGLTKMINNAIQGIGSVLHL